MHYFGYGKASPKDNAEQKPQEAKSQEQVTSKPKPSGKFANFYSKLNDPKTSKISDQIKEFAKKSINPQQSREEQSKLIFEFMDNIEYKFSDLWKESYQDKLQSGEGMEDCVTRSLHSILSKKKEEETEEDKQFDRHIKILKRFLKPEHLDLKQEYLLPSFVSVACEQLRKINSYKTPRDKIIMIQNFSKVISHMLSENKKASPMGADEFLPISIYTIVQAEAKHIKSNLDFIKYFRHPRRLRSEEDYYYTSITTAVNFLAGISPSKLSISAEEYERLYSLNRDKVLEQEEDDTNNLLEMDSSMSEAANSNLDGNSDTRILNMKTRKDEEKMRIEDFFAKMLASKGTQTEEQEASYEGRYDAGHLKGVLDLPCLNKRFENVTVDELRNLFETLQKVKRQAALELSTVQTNAKGHTNGVSSTNGLSNLIEF